MGEPIITLAGITRVFGSDGVETPVLKGIDLSLERGEFAALVGPSGSGKSTLLSIMGLLDRPTTGSVMICGRETTVMGEPERTLFRGESIGFVFQFHHLIPSFTALENVTMPFLLRFGKVTPQVREKAAEMLCRVGLSDRLHFRPTRLSGGQQQRVAVARALVTGPPLVLADEPTGNLDSESGEEVFSLMREMAASCGTTFLLVTHDDRLANRCDTIIRLRDGRIVP